MVPEAEERVPGMRVGYIEEDPKEVAELAH